MKKRLLSLALALVLCLTLLPMAAMAAQTNETPAAADNAVTLYADYGNGFELLSSLYFEDSVTEQSVTVDRPITALRVVKGVCYELNLDRLTLNGACPAGYERKLSATDNDLIEVEDSMDFALSGSGELVIAGRAPVEVRGEEYSFKFPQSPVPITPRSEFYSYTLGSNTGSFADDVLTVPDAEALFITEMCHPTSGHPDAPMDIYVADDGETLYVFFEAFLDNTFDHGKDFASVHVKCGDTVKTYKVRTTEENSYGAWWFDYTDSSDDYDWQHMCYVVEIPLEDLEARDGALDLAFEYYGTAYTYPEVRRLGIGSVALVSEDEARYFPDADLLPAAGVTLNSDGGNTETGEWWLTNTAGTAEMPEYTLTLNGATIDEISNYWDYPLYVYGKLTVKLVEGTVNTIEYVNPSVERAYGIFASGENLIIEGPGTLNVTSTYDPFYAWKATICGGATVNVTLDTEFIVTTYPGGGSSYTSLYTAASSSNGITIDNATMKVTSTVTNVTKPDVRVYGVDSYGGITLKNNALFEVYAYGGGTGEWGGTYGIYQYRKSITCEADEIQYYEGTGPDDAMPVDDFTSVKEDDPSFYSLPYVKLVTANAATLQEILEGAAAFEYTDATPGSSAYTYTGKLTPTVAEDGETGTVDYAIPAATLEEEGPTAMLNDLARFLGALYRYDDGKSVTSVTFDGNAYTWDADSTLEDSRWTHTVNTIDGPTNVSLVSEIEAAFNAAEDPLTGIELKINDYGVTINIDVTVPTYTITVTGGAATVDGKDVTEAAEGDTVTVTADTKSGYTFKEWTVDSENVELADATARETTFTMPAEDVEITAAFTKNSSGGGSGGSSSSSYKITPAAAENGAVTVSPTSAAQGKTVTVTPTPDAGYKTDKVTVTDQNGKDVPVKDNGDGTYSFTMPSVPVEVKATFVEDKAEPTPPTPPVPDDKEKFVDVAKDAWYHAPVYWAVDKGVTNGTDDTHFSPDAACTRAQMVTFLWRAAGEPVVNYAMPFTDLEEGAYYTEAIRWAASEGITKGTSETSFSPDGTVNRAQTVTFLYRYEQSQGGGFTGAWAFPLDYSDASDVPEWAYEAFCWMTMENVIQGADGKLLPLDDCLRSQIVTMLYRYFEA